MEKKDGDFRHPKPLPSSETKGSIPTVPIPIATKSAASQDKQPLVSKTDGLSTRSKDSATSAASKNADKSASSLKPASAPAKAVFVNALPDYDRLVNNIKQAVKTKAREQGSNPSNSNRIPGDFPAPVASDSAEKKGPEPAAKQVRILPRQIEPEEEKTPPPPTAAAAAQPTLPPKSEQQSWPEKYPPESYFHPPSLSYFTSEPPLSWQSRPQQHPVQERYPYPHHNDPYIHRQQQQQPQNFHGQQYYPMQSHPYRPDYPVRNDSFVPRAKTTQRVRESRSSSSSRATKMYSQRANSAARGYQGSGDQHSPLKAREHHREQPPSLLSSTQQPQNRYSAPLRKPRLAEGPPTASNPQPNPNSHTKSQVSELFAINNTVLRLGTIDVLKDPIAIEPGNSGDKGGQRFECAIVAGAFKMEENIRNYVDTLTAVGRESEYLRIVIKYSCYVLYVYLQGPMGN